jgi:transcriptional regulator with XRE-family HTH domain
VKRKTIRELRRAANLTQAELAERIGVSKMSISHWETGRNEPSARQLRALATSFKVAMESILFEREALRERQEGQER